MRIFSIGPVEATRIWLGNLGHASNSCAGCQKGFTTGPLFSQLYYWVGEGMCAQPARPSPPALYYSRSSSGQILHKTLTQIKWMRKTSQTTKYQPNQLVHPSNYVYVIFLSQ